MMDGLKEFAISDKILLSSDLVSKYAGRWVAAYQGDIVVTGDDLNAVLEWISSGNIPMTTVAIRFIEADGREA